MDIKAQEGFRKYLAEIHKKALGSYEEKGIVPLSTPQCEIFLNANYDTGSGGMRDLDYGRPIIRINVRNINLPEKVISSIESSMAVITTLHETAHYIHILINPRAYKEIFEVDGTHSILPLEDRDITEENKERKERREGFKEFVAEYCAWVTARQIIEDFPTLNSLCKGVRLIKDKELEIAYRLATEQSLEDAWRLVPLILRSDLTKLL